jgi:hypothetical protein
VLTGGFGSVPDQLRGGIRSADLEPGEPLWLLVGHVHRGDLRAARPAAADLDQLVNGGGVTLEDGLHRSLSGVPNPAGDAQRVGTPSEGVPEEDTLDSAADDDPPAGQRELLLFVLVLGRRADA